MSIHWFTLQNCRVLFLILPVGLSPRLTGAAVQVACETRSGRRRSRAVTSDLSFSRLELLECLWENGKPEYNEVENLCSSLNWLKNIISWSFNIWLYNNNKHVSLFLCSCFSSRNQVFSRSGLQPGRVPNFTTASVKNTCARYAHAAHKSVCFTS